MSDNDSNRVLAEHDPNSILARENADLRSRLASLERSNVANGGFSGVVTQYQLNEAGFYDDTWFAAGTVIDYIDTPNLSMVPLNDPAKRAMQDHIETLENG